MTGGNTNHYTTTDLIEQFAPPRQCQLVPTMRHDRQPPPATHRHNPPQTPHHHSALIATEVSRGNDTQEYPHTHTHTHTHAPAVRGVLCAGRALPVADASLSGLRRHGVIGPHGVGPVRRRTDAASAPLNPEGQRSGLGAKRPPLSGLVLLLSAHPMPRPRRPLPKCRGQPRAVRKRRHHAERRMFGFGRKQTRHASLRRLSWPSCRVRRGGTTCTPIHGPLHHMSHTGDETRTHPGPHKASLKAGCSSVGRASDCRFQQLSDGPWFDSGRPDMLTRAAALSVGL